MTSKEKAEKLHEISEALEEWGKYNEKVTNAAEWSTPVANQIIRKAMTLLVDNLALLNECKNKYGCFNPLTQCFMSIEQAASWSKTKDLGDCQAWTCDFTESHLWGGEKRSLADECVRYAKEVNKETEQGNKNTKGGREGEIEPKPPKIFQEALWILKYGKKYWWLLFLVALVSLSLYILPRLNLFGSEHQNIHPEAKTSGGSSQIKVKQPIELIPNISIEDLDKRLIELRSSEKLRKLTPLETGRSILEAPLGTYFFVFYAHLISSDGNVEYMLKYSLVDSYKNRPSCFEIHKRIDGQIILLGYVGDEIGASLSNASQSDRKEIVLFPSPWENFQNLVMIPVNRIFKSNNRRISSSETGDISVLDMLIE